MPCQFSFVVEEAVSMRGISMGYKYDFKPVLCYR